MGGLCWAAALRMWAPAGNLGLLFVQATRGRGHVRGPWRLRGPAADHQLLPAHAAALAEMACLGMGTGVHAATGRSRRARSPLSRGMVVAPAQESSAPAEPSSSKVLGLSWALLGPTCDWFLTLEESPDADDFIEAPAAGVDGELSGHDGMDALCQCERCFGPFHAAPVVPTRCVSRMVVLSPGRVGVLQ
jgi:hypothetical protein